MCDRRLRRVSFEPPVPGMEGATSKFEVSFEHKEPSSEHKGALSEHSGPMPPLCSGLEFMASELRGRKRAKPAVVDKVLLALMARFLP